MSEPREEVDLRPRPWAERLKGSTVWLLGIVALAIIWLIGWSLISAGKKKDARKQERDEKRPALVQQESGVPGFLRRDPNAERRPPAESAPAAETVTIPAFVERGRVSGPRGAQEELDTDALARHAEIVPSGWKRGGGGSSSPGGGLPAPGDLRREILAGLSGFGDAEVEAPAPAVDPEPKENLSEQVHAVSRGSIQQAPILPRGAVIPVTMARRVQTDGGCYPVAIVRRPVYARSGELLIAGGSLLHGECSGTVLRGVARLFVRWDRIDTPQGERLDLTAALPSGHLDGSLGTGGRLKTHFWRTLRDAALISVVSAGAQLAQPEGQRTGFGVGVTDRQVVAEAVAQELSRVAIAQLERNLDRPQTMIVEEGARFTVVLNRDLVIGG